MNRKEGIIMCLVLLGTFVGGVFASNPTTQMLNVFVTNFPQTSHLGQPITNHVVLHCNPGYLSNDLLCTRLFPDGTFADFSIPAGSALVVTDVTWLAFQLSPGKTYQFAISLRSASAPSGFVAVSVATAYGAVEGLGSAFASVHMTAGFVVSPTATMVENGDTSSVVLTLQGYLITAA